MLKFTKAQLSDIHMFREYVSKQTYRTCDYSAGAIFMWRNAFQLEYAIFENTLIMKDISIVDGETKFVIPIGQNVDGAIKKIEEYCVFHKIPLRYHAVPVDGLKQLKKHYSNISVVTDRDFCDYLYDAENMKQFAGRRYSGQRNHINRFLKLYGNYQFHKITSENLDHVLAFYEWFREEYHKDSEFAEEESSKVIELLTHYETYQVVGGFITVDDHIIAMAIGEKVYDTLFVHIEKADIRYHGAYQMIVREFARAYADETVRYINREEDMGDEGLRTSKLSYHPVQLLEKSMVDITL